MAVTLWQRFEYYYYYYYYYYSSCNKNRECVYIENYCVLYYRILLPSNHHTGNTSYIADYPVLQDTHIIIIILANRPGFSGIIIIIIPEIQAISRIVKMTCLSEEKYTYCAWANTMPLLTFVWLAWRELIKQDLSVMAHCVFEDWKHITCAHSALYIHRVTGCVAPRGVDYRSVGRRRRMERAVQVAFYSAEIKSKVEKTVCTCM